MPSKPEIGFGPEVGFEEIAIDLLQARFWTAKQAGSWAKGSAMVNASELHEGMVIRIEGQVYKVLEVESKAKAVKMGGVVTTAKSVEELQLDRHTMIVLYADGNHFYATSGSQSSEVRQTREQCPAKV